ncbi:MAG: hypothetical protein RRY13_04175 [Akkermansia sp.]
MFLKPRTFLFIALFQIALGIGLIMGGILQPCEVSFYSWIFRQGENAKYVSLVDNGIDPQGVIQMTPYQYSEPPPVPILSLDKQSCAPCFATYPPEPMDLTVLFYQLRNHGVRNIGILAPFVWQKTPDEVVTNALSYEIISYPHARIGRTLSLSARDSILPKEWSKLVLPQTQYAGDISKIPPANKLYGETPQITQELHPVPSIIENDDLFVTLAKNEQTDKSMPLFIRWNQQILPTFPLLIALDALNLSLADVHVYFGGALRLGDRAPIAIDESARINLRPGLKSELLSPTDILSSLREGQQTPDNKNAHASLPENAITVLVAEAPLGANQVSDSVLLTGKTIKNLLSTLTPNPPLAIHPVSDTIQWIILLDLLVIALWALRFRGWLRQGILSSCILIIPLIALYEWMQHGEWLPVTPGLSALIVICLASHFIHPPKIDEEDEDNDNDRESSPPHSTKKEYVKKEGEPSMPEPEQDYEEPSEIPIPQTKAKNKSKEKTRQKKSQTRQ